MATNHLSKRIAQAGSEEEKCALYTLDADMLRSLVDVREHAKSLERELAQEEQQAIATHI